MIFYVFDTKLIDIDNLKNVRIINILYKIHKENNCFLSLGKKNKNFLWFFVNYVLISPRSEMQ